MDRSKQFQLYFLGFFIVFPIIFIVSSILWRTVILDKPYLMVATDAFGILGIYNFIMSIIFIFTYRKKIKMSVSRKAE